MDGTPSRICTYDLFLRTESLYLLSYGGINQNKSIPLSFALYYQIWYYFARANGV